jgi:hypothetical protein
VWRWVGTVLAVVALAVTSIGLTRLDEPFEVAGTFILWDEFVAETGELCDAKRSFYHDINRDTPVTLSAGGDLPLDATSLGNGRIASAAEMVEILHSGGNDLSEDEATELLEMISLEPCVFRFDFIVQPGSDEGRGYVVALGRRGTWSMTEDEIRQPGRLQLSVGLRGRG